jgi:hypothetical protein
MNELLEDIEYILLFAKNPKRQVPPEVVTHIRLAKDILVGNLHDGIMSMSVDIGKENDLI